MRFLVLFEGAVDVILGDVFNFRLVVAQLVDRLVQVQPLGDRHLFLGLQSNWLQITWKIEVLAYLLASTT